MLHVPPTVEVAVSGARRGGRGEARACCGGVGGKGGRQGEKWKEETSGGNSLVVILPPFFSWFAVGRVVRQNFPVSWNLGA